jgi:molybdenum cofactor synthesis domain-containing protein
MTAAPGERPLQAKVLTVSESVALGQREDRSGAALVERLAAAGYEVVDRVVVPDGLVPVSEAIQRLCRDFCGLVVTTGGTGFGPHDLTPEATRSVLEREAPGLVVAMLSADPRGRLSRGAAGTLGRALVVNAPGSPGGAVDCLETVLDVVPHALELMAGGHPH